jgi:hypothetical protein
MATVRAGAPSAVRNTPFSLFFVDIPHEASMAINSIKHNFDILIPIILQSFKIQIIRQEQSANATVLCRLPQR